MKDSLIIFACLIGGGLVGYYWGDSVPAILLDSRTSMMVIYVLLFTIGLNLGTDMEKVKLMLRMPWIIWTLPVFTCIGSIGGAAFMTLFTPQISGLEGAAIGAGLGWYSLSSIIIGSYGAASLATVALISNIIREATALLMVPLIGKKIGPMAAISLCGANSADVCLPVVQNAVGASYTIPSIFHGIVTNILVPVLVGFFCELIFVI